MSPDLSSLPEWITETTDPAKAYFTYSTDHSGEYGMISANREGLRLYAAELLRIARQMEQAKDDKPLFFDHHEWMVSQTGYSLVEGVMPLFMGRGEILSAEPVPAPPPARKGGPGTNDPSTGKGCLVHTLLWVLVSMLCLVCLFAVLF